MHLYKFTSYSRPSFSSRKEDGYRGGKKGFQRAEDNSRFEPGLSHPESKLLEKKLFGMEGSRDQYAIYHVAKPDNEGLL